MSGSFNHNKKEERLAQLFYLHLVNGPQFEFFVDALKNALLFFVIAGFAAGLNLLITNFEKLGISKIILFGLESIEYLMFASDIIWFTVFLFFSTYKLVKALAFGKT